MTDFSPWTISLAWPLIDKSQSTDDVSWVGGIDLRFVQAAVKEATVQTALNIFYGKSFLLTLFEVIVIYWSSILVFT